MSSFVLITRIIKTDFSCQNNAKNILGQEICQNRCIILSNNLITNQIVVKPEFQVKLNYKMCFFDPSVLFSDIFALNLVTLGLETIRA